MSEMWVEIHEKSPLPKLYHLKKIKITTLHIFTQGYKNIKHLNESVILSLKYN